MKKYLFYIVICAMAFLQAQRVYGQNLEELKDRPRDKRAQSGLQFLDVPLSPRQAALAQATTAIDLASSQALFQNPATMATLEGGHLSLANVQFIADINYSGGSFAYSPMGGRYGVFGVSVLSVDYGEFEATIPLHGADPSQGEPDYSDPTIFTPSALAVGVGYAKALTDRFSVGGNARYVRQSLGETVMDSDGTTKKNEVSTPVFDLGVFYRTGFRSLNIAMMARNFSPALRYEDDYFEAPLALNIGASMNLMDFMGQSSDMHAFLLSVDAGHPRSYDEQMRIGGEYQFMNTLFLRAGYAFPTDEQGINLGAGLNLGFSGLSFSADYSYSQFGIFDSVNRIGVQVGF